LPIRINGNEFPLPIRYDFVENEEGPCLDITFPRGRRYAQEQVKERIKLLSTHPKYGETRWYFSCPFTTEGEHCGNRVLKLYLPAEERRFGCRECHELTYESTQQSHKYDGLYALLAGKREGETYDFLKGGVLLYDKGRKETKKGRPRRVAGGLRELLRRRPIGPPLPANLVIPSSFLGLSNGSRIPVYGVRSLSPIK
jgi:hypothetical protein